MKAYQTVLVVIAAFIGFTASFYVTSNGIGGGWFLWLCLAVGVGIPLFLLFRLRFINKAVRRAGKDEEATARSSEPRAGAAALFVFRDQFAGAWLEPI